jgi:3-methyladenine DNA glycosylase AlkD
MPRPDGRFLGGSATRCVLTCSTAHRSAWAKVTHWSSSKREFVKRTAFALLWSLSVHEKRAGNEPFVQGLVLIERPAGDERNFVRKAVNMALRAIGKRNRALDPPQ